MHSAIEKAINTLAETGLTETEIWNCIRDKMFDKLQGSLSEEEFIPDMHMSIDRGYSSQEAIELSKIKRRIKSQRRKIGSSSENSDSESLSLPISEIESCDSDSDNPQVDFYTQKYCSQIEELGKLWVKNLDTIKPSYVGKKREREDSHEPILETPP